MKVKHMWIAFIVFLISAVGFRTYQTMYLIEPDTGFLPIGDKSIYILLGIMALYVCVLLLMSFLCKNVPKEYQPKRNIPAGLFSLISSALLFVDSFNNILAYTSDLNNMSSLIAAVFSVLSGLNFLLLAIGSFAGENILKKVPVLSVGACVWACERSIILTIIEHNNILGISYNMLNIVGVLAMILFLFTQAKLLSQVATEKTGKRCIMLGLLAIVFMSVYLLPDMFMKVNTGTDLTFNNMLMDIIDMSIILYIISFSIEATSCFSNVERKSINYDRSRILHNDNASIKKQEVNPLSIKEDHIALEKDDDSPVKRVTTAQRPQPKKNLKEEKKKSDGVDMTYIDEIINDIVSKD